ncbi:SH3 domain-binding protein 2-like [Branchiostoma floridae]|uniref:SH3 domain-binding protein 2-like n=1 Tax=Branchiostoma floridae TaxID=7739 RepID=A0A9J7KYC6_BRAFL|nr:SH3 domain-binding protein 2-like [Branchiostoma floridae]XP_035672775.1 SH3 domain-binding protein 2-like [Branchiostoma floridae]
MAGAKDSRNRLSGLSTGLGEVRKSILDKLSTFGQQDKHVPPGVTEPHITIGAQELLSDGKAVFYGWLRKKGNDAISQKFMRWKHRYVILKDGCVYYFKNETSEKPCGAFSLSSYTKIMRAEDVKTAELPWPFKLISKYGQMRTWYFSASNEQDMQHWMLNLQKEMDAVNSCTSSQGAPGVGHTTRTSGGGRNPGVVVPDPAYGDGSGLPIYHDADEEDHFYEDPDEDLAEEEDYLQVRDDNPRVAPVGAEAAQDHRMFPDKPLPPTPTSRVTPASQGFGQAGTARPPFPLPKNQNSGPTKPPPETPVGGQRSPKKALVPPHMAGVPSLPSRHAESKGKVPSPPWKELKDVKKASEPINITPGRTAGRTVGPREAGVGKHAKNKKKENPMVGALVAEMNQRFGENWQAAGGTAKPIPPDKPVSAAKPDLKPKPGLPPKPGTSPKPGLAPKPGHPPRQGTKPLVPPHKPQVEVQGIMEDRYEHEDEEEVPVEDPGIRRTPPEGNSFSKKNFNENPENETDDVMPADVSEDVDIEKAESRLRWSQVDGKYFLRPSKQDKGKMVLVVYDCAGQKCRKFKMYGLGSQVHLHKGEPTFSCIPDLLRHYQYHNLPVSDEGVIRLTEPYKGH